MSSETCCPDGKINELGLDILGETSILSNMKKVYYLGAIEYGYVTGTKKWLFKSQRYQLRISVSGGAPDAHKIAALVDKGLIRNGGDTLDNTARNAIAKYSKM